jgi:hypothetical protein
VNRRALDELKQQIPLLKYLQGHDWQQAWPIGFGRLLGLCPLHADHKPSFLVDPQKNLFYCYGCRRGGDVIRFAELYHQVEFGHAVALLREWCGVAPLLHQAVITTACSYTDTASRKRNVSFRWIPSFVISWTASACCGLRIPSLLTAFSSPAPAAVSRSSADCAIPGETSLPQPGSQRGLSLTSCDTMPRPGLCRLRASQQLLTGLSVVIDAA